jgi:hypothetical protein
MIHDNQWDAERDGHIHYFTGVPCKFGHISKRYTSSFHCVDCQHARSKKWWQSDEVKLAKKEKHIRETYGISLAETQLVTNCEICSMELTADRGPRGRCVDHNHETKEVRGILCNHCNRAIGLLMDNPSLLDKAADYLRNADKQVPQKWIDE